MKLLEHLKRNKILIVVRGLNKDETLLLCSLLLKNNLNCLEVSFSDKGADEILKAVKEEFKSQIFLGAGTIFDEKMYVQAIKAGASYVLSPGFSKIVAELAKKDNIPYIPGVYTPTDVQMAYNEGFRLVKLYPADVEGLRLLKSYHGPFPDVEFMPFGGVTPENISAYFNSGAVAVGIGSYIANKSLLAKGDISELSQRIKKIAAYAGD
ncbi:bifunctional 4-hydroxy-2-oxoglutarate aldolase/2-dehydro-3-deoxy-phosphogluconate aldolase [Pseudothermotoga sp. U03pept]|uniref:bifunctional 4-hydroxy-2-oxoglutarate aldolase/2-dehydro-3-deoxy-phosphogluconate aldolase n=1 Tax=Pseudothermotoga sp. U03pept TaxID=3447012 RepID=UPI003F0F2410